MEVKDVIYLVLGSNFIIALATFLATYLTTRMQVKNSDKRFEKELEKAREDAKRNRRWEVRSEPLLKLREELAIITAKYQNCLGYEKSILRSNEKSGELGKKQFESTHSDAEQVLNDFKDYFIKGFFEKAVYAVDDVEIQVKINVLFNEISIMNSIIDQAISSLAQLDNLEKIQRVFEDDVRKIQSLINQKLEAL